MVLYIAIIIALFLVLAAFLRSACVAETRRARIAGATRAFVWAGLMFAVSGTIENLNLHYYYSHAAAGLLESSVEGIKAGKAEAVSTELTAMRSNFRVTYEGQGNFRTLAIAATERIRAQLQENSKGTAEQTENARGEPNPAVPVRRDLPKVPGNGVPGY